MEENTYILDILSNLGLAINEENNSEIIINFPINYDKKSMQFKINKEYKITMQPIGTFLTDFLNCDFEIKNDFINFFNKYSLSLLEYKKLMKCFTDFSCTEKKFNLFLDKMYNDNFKNLKKLQEQTDMIIDYCLINPNNKAKDFTPIERFYVLRRISPNLTLLNENKAAYYTVNLFSSFPGESEKEIYKFLSNKKNKITEFDLILPYNLSSIIYKSLSSILKEKVYLKTCKNCNRYFIAKSKNIEYCLNIAPGETKKTCKDIGKKEVFNNRKSEDPLLILYYKIYNRKATMKRRNPDIKKYVEDYDKFKRTGKLKLEKYKKNKISAEEFRSWLDRNS